MSKKYLLHRVAVVFFAVCFAVAALVAVLFAMPAAHAADEDTVTVSALSVEWDGNSGGNDLVMLTLNGATFQAGQNSNSHWDYFSPYIYVNGTAVSGQVAWATEGMYANTSQFCFFLAQDILRQDGSDVIEVREGCRIPLNDGADYYVVSETATFAAPANATGSGTEPFVAGSSVTVDGVSVEWDGNSGNNDLVTLSLEGAAFDSNVTSNTHRHEIEAYIFVNGTQISDVAWAIEGRYTNPKHYCFYLPQGVLKQDGTDVIEVRRGCHIPVNDGASYYVVSETATFAAPANATGSGTEQFVRQFSWAADTKYDASGEIFVTNSAQQGVLGGYDSQGVAIGNMSQDHPEWGLPLTEYSAQTINALAEGQFAVFAFTTPFDTATFKSLTFEYMYNEADALFYVYPLDAEMLGYEHAVQSFRTVGSGINSVTLSAEALVGGNGSFGGFILQLVAGTGAQFFMDSVTLSEDPFVPGAVENPEAPAEPQKQGDVTVSSVQVNWQATSAMVYIHLGGASYPTYNNVVSQELYGYFLPYIKVNGHTLSEYASPLWSVQKGYYGDSTRVMVQVLSDGAYSLQNDGNDVIEILQGCRFPVDGEGAIDYYEVSETAAFRSVSGGNVAEGDASRETFVEQIDWEAQKYDADGSVFMDVAAQQGALGGYDSQRVLPHDFSAPDYAGWGLTGYAAYTADMMQNEQFAVFRLTTPVDVAEFKSVVIEYKYDSPDALFYVCPLDTDALGYDYAVQSFRTVGSGVNAVTLSTEALVGENGTFGGFILWLADGGSANFFLDSITPSAESYTPEDVEEVVAFEWTLEQLFDADSDAFVPTQATQIGDFTSLPVVVRNVDQWGITAFAAFAETALGQGQFLRFEFAVPVDTATAKSMTLGIMHNAAAGFYIYPLDAAALGMEHAAQSFRTTGGVENISVSLPELADGSGLVHGFLVQLMTDTGAQFFLDSVTLSAETVEAEVEDFTLPPYETQHVSIIEVSYTYRYEGGYDDLLMITFDRRIFTVANERVVPDDFAEHLLINGVSVAESGIGDYALRGMFQRYDRLGIFIKNGQSGSMNNDAFDTVTFKAGFAIRGSTDDYTLYTTQADAVFYTNRALDEGQQVDLSAEYDPRADQTLTPVAVSFTAENGQATLTVTFDKTVRSDEASQAEDVQEYILVDGRKLSEIGGVTVSYADSATFSFTFAYTPASESVQVAVAAGLTVQTNPDQPLTQKTVRVSRTFVCAEDGTYYADDNTALGVWWVSAPVVTAADADDPESIARMTFEIRLSVQNAAADSITGEMKAHILIGDTPLTEILAADSGSSAVLQTFAIAVTIPASYLQDGLTVTVKEGMRTPAGGTLAADEVFTYDGVFDIFVGEVHREEAEPLLTPTGINSILTATDGVEEGSNQLFIEFTTPCSFKYLPFAQADAATIFASYGSVGVNIPARYVYELNRYGMRESLWDDLYIDGVSVREWAVKDGGKDASRLIDMYYQGTNFGVYYLQIVISKFSSAAMDWSKPHSLTFKEGFVTPTFGVFEEDVQFAWDPAAQTWAPDASADATVDSGAQLKPSDGDDLFTTVGGSEGLAIGLSVGGAAVVVAAVVATGVLVRKKKAAKAAQGGGKERGGDDTE